MTRLPVVFLFGGQGSHYTRMGAELCAHDAVFGGWCRRLDVVARDVLGVSALEAVWRVPGDGTWACDRLSVTHPAIFIVQYALCQRLMAAGVQPDYVLGASLGETVAATVSGALTPEDAVRLLCRQALGVERDCPEGGMLAIVDSPDLFQREERLSRHTVIAAFNHARHFVVSAGRPGLASALDFLASTDVLHQELPVRYAFHSAWIDMAAASYREASRALRVGRCRVPLLSPAYESALDTLPESYFWDVARQPVYFERTLRLLERSGPYLYVDCSPSGTLDSFLRQILPSGGSSSIATLSPFGQDVRRLNQALQRLGVADGPEAAGAAASGPKSPGRPA